MRPLDGLALGFGRKLPVLRQTEAAECGIACLAMIASYHGHLIDVATLRRRFAISAKGTTLASLSDFAGRLELATRAVRLEIDDLRYLKLPCILHWRFTHFVVLARVGKRGVRIHDPAEGVRSLAFSEVEAEFTGVALELWPSPGFAPCRAPVRARLRELVGAVEGMHRTLAEVLVLAIALEAFVIANPLFLQWVVDQALVTANRDLLTLLACGFAMVLICEQAAATVRAWLIMHVESTLGIQWRANVFEHLVRLPLPYFEKRHLGDIVSRFRSTDAVQRTVTTAFVEAIVDGCMATVLLAVMARYSVTLTWICIAATALYGLGRLATYSPLRAAADEQIASTAKQESHFIETIRGLRAIKLFERHDERRAAWLALLVQQVNAALRGQRIHVLLRLANGLLFGAENIVVVLVGAHAVLDGGFSVGMLVAFVAYQRQFSARVSALIDKAFELRLLRLHAERLADIVLTEPESGPTNGGRLLTSATAEPAAALEIRGLRFRYAQHEAYVLDGVELEVAAGEAVAIVGASGCGKSTLVHLVLGILPVTEGEISIGGLRVAAGERGEARRLVASVTQHDTLFAGSLADNISFFDPDADQARIEECARIASIHAEIAALPMAYNTLVGYLGSMLSAGQQQRVLLARALYRRPSVLVLDEATSHLDLRREILVSTAIRALDVTRIVVAHRPQTVATADRVVKLDGGRIVRDTRLSPNAAALHRARLAPAASRTSAEDVS
jgi:ATP-binding cassette subfamily B protein RaxB